MKTSKEFKAKMAEILPGETYPRFVKITEKIFGKQCEVCLYLQSYYVGMYCAIHIDGDNARQIGDHDNKTFVTKLKKDISAAIKRGAKVEIAKVSLVKKDF